MSGASKKEAGVVELPLKRGVGRPSQVSLEQIFAAISAIGLGNLTLQAVAEALGVTSPALYRLVDGREDLIEKYVAEVMERFPAPAYHGEGWSSWAARYAHALLEMYAAVPGLADYSIRRTPTAQNVLDRHETSIKAAKESGFDEISALYVTRAIIEFVAGWVARSERRDAFERELKVHPDVAFRKHVVAEKGGRYPHLRASLEAVSQLESSHRFDFTLRALIAGLTSTLDAAARPETETP